MKAAVWYAANDIRVETVSPPHEPAADEVVVRVHWCGICGTDVHEYRAGPQVIWTTPHPLTGAHGCQILGHEFAGDVVAVGSDAGAWKPGDRVAIMPLIYCGRCYYCQRGQQHLCEIMACCGLSWRWGGLAEQVVVKAYQLTRLPDNVSYEQGALAEPAAVACYAIERSGIREGDTVLVAGAGPIGCLTILAAQAAGAAVVYVSEPAPPRRRLATQLGATAVFDPLATSLPDRIMEATGGIGVDVAFECVGHEKSLRDCTASLRKQGTLVQTGLFVAPATVEPFLWSLRDLTVVGTWCYHVYDLPRVLALIAGGKLPVERIITDHIGIDDVVAAGFEPLIAGQQVKVLVGVD